MDLDCYLAIRKTALEPRPGRGGCLERAASARRQGAVDIAMIGLMRDTRLRACERGCVPSLWRRPAPARWLRPGACVVETNGRVDSTTFELVVAL